MGLKRYFLGKIAVFFYFQGIVDWWVTGTILGVVGIIAGFLFLILPETRNKAMCDTLQDIENRGKN